MQKKVRTLLLVASVTWLAVVSLSTSAMAIMIGLTNEDLTRQSSLVVIGNVVDKSSYWNADRTTIYTGVSIAVKEVVRGNEAPQTLTLQYEGGEVGDIGLRVSDTPQFENGEDVLLFLKRLPSVVGERSSEAAQPFYVVGSGQGKYSIEMNAIATRGGFSIVNDNKGKAFKNVIPLNELKEQIRSVQ
ncbi:MAG: hypothetical protein HQL03_10905 [Nitrospirae bacterium]|nr:hypothetical protein [Nitrospirota bacterium]MBF0592461.1 hypothetical protein [Nitrospirota bacterium]